MGVPTVALPPKVRAVVYYVYALVALGLGGTQVGYAAAEAGQPTWLTVALAVLAFLGAGLGVTAASNTVVTKGLDGGDGFIAFHDDAPDNPTP